MEARRARTRAFRALSVRAAVQWRGSGAYEVARSFWLAHVAEAELTAHVEEEWSTEGGREVEPALAGLGTVLFRASQGKSRHVVVQAGDAVASVHVYRGRAIEVLVGASDDATARAFVDAARSVFPEPRRDGGERRVRVRFWSCGTEGATSRTELVETCDWTAIEHNYSEATCAALAPLMRNEERAGRLTLWLGPPGVGKTHALRALAWENRSRLSVHYVLDPESFLARVDYLMDVFVDEDHDEGARRARLVVLEDAGELLAPDARDQVGQGLSRLLNLTDGLPGQATDTRVLITSNEELGRLHPAVSRAGRCASVVRFEPFDAREARAWLARHERGDAHVDAPVTLAELFAVVRGEAEPPRPRARCGFRWEA